MSQRIVTVTRDQAVWERETFQVTVPDTVPEDEVKSYALEQVEAGKASEARDPYILNSVEGMDTIVEVQR